MGVHEKVCGIDFETLGLGKNHSWPKTSSLQRVISKFSGEYSYDVFLKEILPHSYAAIFKIVYNYHGYHGYLQGLFQDDEGSKVIKDIENPFYMDEFASIYDPEIKEEIDKIYAFFGSNSCKELRRCKKKEEDFELVAFIVCKDNAFCEHEDDECDDSFLLDEYYKDFYYYSRDGKDVRFINPYKG